MILQKVGAQLYEQGIIGYCTIELIVSLAPVDLTLPKSQQELATKTLFWAMDLKFGYTDYMANFNFINFTHKSSKKILKSGLTTNVNFSLDSEKHISQTTLFSIPYVIEPIISQIKMNDIIKLFKTESLVYDINKSSGVIFHLPDLLQCGMFGLSGVGSTNKECYKLMEDCLALIKSNVS